MAIRVYDLVGRVGMFQKSQAFLLQKSSKTRIIIWHQSKQYTITFGEIPQNLPYIRFFLIWSPQNGGPI